MHLRAPSTDQGVQAFIWALVFFLFNVARSALLGINAGIALVVTLVVSALIFLFVRLRGGDYPGPR